MEFSEGYKTLISYSTKYEKRWTLIIIFNPDWEQKVK